MNAQIRVHTMLGNVSWQIMLLVSVDLLYAILFYVALKETEKGSVS